MTRHSTYKVGKPVEFDSKFDLEGRKALSSDSTFDLVQQKALSSMNSTFDLEQGKCYQV